MIEKPKNGVSHPKNDLLKKISPPNFFFNIFFLANLDKHNDRKNQKWGKSPQK